MKRLIPCLAIFFLVACSISLPDAASVGLPTPSRKPTAAAPQPASTASPTQVPPITPTQAVPLGPTASPTLSPTEAPFNFQSLHMLDEQNGWAMANRYSGTTGSVLRTVDGGLNWRNVTPAQPPSRGYFLDAQTAWLAFNDLNASTTRMANTLDGGETWAIYTSTMFQYYDTDIVFLNSMDGWAENSVSSGGTTYIRAYETHDGGATWPQVVLPSNPNGPLSNFPGVLEICDLCRDNFYYDPSRLIIIRGDLGSDPVGYIRLFITTNMGQTWKEQKLPLPDSKFADGLVVPLKPIFFGTTEGLLPFGIVKDNPDGTDAYRVLSIYATHDGGLSWTPSSAVVDVDSLYFPAMDFVSPLEVFVACGNGLCATYDGAKTWQTLATNLNFAHADGIEYVQQFDFASASTGWAITTHEDQTTLWKTTDGGRTWVKLTPVVASVLDADALSAAQDTLQIYLEALADGNYASVVELFGGDYLNLQQWVSDVDPDDHRALIEGACKILMCELRLRRIVKAWQVSPSEFHFLIQYETADQQLFTRGPCCGANETEMPPQSEFEHVVVRNSHGKFVVIGLAIYVP